ncbi:14520_t:CDS:10 [Entrophospora sp. SA101]|nr:14520_t:CDS:10 [Entrophospora sp. SA101]
MNYSQPSALSPDYNNFIKHNVYYNEPAYKKPIESEYYIIKGYDDIISYKREIDALISLKGAKNIMQIIDYDSHKIVVVSECALYDLETFFDHQAWTQRQAEKMPIIKDILILIFVNKIVHLDLSPKNIMYFRDENWKLIDFDSACIADKTHVSKTTTIKYCSPELIQAEEDGKWIKAQFSMDMFSFGLILYYIENGYWNIADQKCPDKKLPITTIDEPYAADVIEKLLEKNVNNRMTLAQFKETTYYKKLSKFNDAQDDFNHAQNKTIVEESKYSLLEKAYHEKCKMQIEKEAKELNPDIKDDELKQMNVDLQQERFLLFLERYHQEMKISLKDMNKKLDEVKTSVLNLTETIPRMNEKTPRVFIMVPQRREFKNPMTWYTNPFRMYFVCEHNNNWHVPEQEGYVITKVPEFIKKYGPWIQLCIEALVFGLRVATSNLFPQEIGNILSGIFNVKIDNSDEIVQYFQEIIDTIGVGVKEINDNNPDLVPLERDRESNYQVLNASGIRALASFVKSKQNSENFGGLVQCIDKKNQNVIWLCSEHRNDNDYTLKDEPQSPHSPHPSNRNSTIMYGSHLHHPSSSRSYFPTSPTPPTSPPPSIQPSRNFTLGSTHSFNNNQNYYNNNGHDNYPNCEDDGPFSSQPISRSDSRESSLIMDINYPVPLIYFVNDILVDVLNNALSSDCAHFGIDEIKKETHNMRENLAGLAQFYQNWLNSQQKRLLNTILKRYIVGYVYFLTMIYRYCYVKLTHRFRSRTIHCFSDLPVVHKIIKLTNALNEFYAESIICLESNDRKGIEQNLNKLDSSSKILNKYSQYNKLMKNNALKEWYIISKTSMIHDECDGEDRENKDEYKQVFNDILVIKNRMLKGNIPVFGKELDPECFNDEDNINCIEKEIYMYKPILHYEYANYGNLYEYLKNNQTLPENEKLTLNAKLNLSLDICFGLEFLHERHILHLDLRSSNIYLFKNGYENEFLKPKISNFLYSVDTLNNHTTVKPCLPKSIDNQVRKRWHEPQRLKNEKYNCTFESDYYSLGMLLWEIFHATGALPYEKIKIENLYEHLRSKNGPESLPNNLLEQLYEHLKNGYEGFPKNLHKSLLSKITKLWEYNINGRTTVTAMIAILRRFNKKRRTISSSTRCTISTISTFSTVSTDKTAVNTKYVTKSEEVIQRYSEEIDI